MTSNVMVRALHGSFPLWSQSHSPPRQEPRPPKRSQDPLLEMVVKLAGRQFDERVAGKQVSTNGQTFLGLWALSLSRKPPPP